MDGFKRKIFLFLTDSHLPESKRYGWNERWCLEFINRIELRGWLTDVKTFRQFSE